MSEIIYEIGDFKIYTIGVFIFLALSCGHFFTKRRYGFETYSEYKYPFVFILSLVFGLAFEFFRNYIFTMSSLFDFDVLFYNLSISSIMISSYAFYYLIFKYYFIKRNPKLWIRRATNMFLFFIITGGFLVSLGLFYSGHGFGTPTNLPWGVVYYSIDSIVPYSVPIHPTQIYMAIVFLLSWILVTLQPINSTYVFFMIIVPAYFLVDFIMGDVGARYLGLSIEQYVCILTLLLFFYSLLVKIFIRKNKEISG